MKLGELIDRYDSKKNPMLDGATVVLENGTLAQLRRLSGRQAVFQTAVAVVRADAGYEEALLAPVTVRFRTLNDDEIERYLRLDEPYDCAGSAKSETLGIALLDAIDSDDPTALVGLPLIRTCRMLRQAGLDPLMS